MKVICCNYYSYSDSLLSSFVFNSILGCGVQGDAGQLRFRLPDKRIMRASFIDFSEIFSSHSSELVVYFSTYSIDTMRLSVPMLAGEDAYY